MNLSLIPFCRHIKLATMADNDGGWGALFAKAAGTQPEQPLTRPHATKTSPAAKLKTPTIQSNTDNDKLPNKKRKRKRLGGDNDDNSKRHNNTTKREEEEFNAMLQDRTSIPDKHSPWPSWMSLGRSLISKDCQQWKGNDNNDDNKGRCCNCEESALYHCLDFKQLSSSWHDGDDSWVFRVFCRLRNIRSCAKRIVTLSSDHHKDEDDKRLSQILGSLHDENQLLKSLSPSFHEVISCPDETELLTSKWTNLEERFQVLKNVLMRESSTTVSYKKKAQSRGSCKKKIYKVYLEPVVRLMIACDAIYHRCYYLQLTRMLPPWKINRSTGAGAFLPHPPFYFGLPFLTMDLDQAHMAATQLLATMKEEGDEDALAMLQHDPLLRLLHNPLNDGSKRDPKYSITKEETLSFEHALSAIHRYRFLESIMIFHQTSWASSSHSKRLLETSLATVGNNDQFQKKSSSEDMFYQQHETPAPPILMEWRDSCRDMMCNLYAYATIPDSKSLSRLLAKHFPEYCVPSNHGGRILDIGAGTGYIAHLLQVTGLQVEASDVHPTPTSPVVGPRTTTMGQLSTPTMNEYHGFTPPFCCVSKSSKFVISTKDANDTALLLCYPPPLSPMAQDSLQAYSDAGGTLVVHIGEFKGLTGSRGFEKLLSRHFQCLDRQPCSTWGSDASQISVWGKNRSVKCKPTISAMSMNLLLPCSSCQKREATKRYRLVRSVVYCSRECWNRDSKCRRQRLRLSMLDSEDSMLDYENEEHYRSL